MTGEKCVFKTGDQVRYSPTTKGFDLETATPQTTHLIPGSTYAVQAVVNDEYVVVEGYSHPGGGLHWTEFSEV